MTAPSWRKISSVSQIAPFAASTHCTYFLNTRRLTRRRSRRGPASVRRPSRLVKSKSGPRRAAGGGGRRRLEKKKSERGRAACTARLTGGGAGRRPAVATWALAAQL